MRILRIVLIAVILVLALAAPSQYTVAGSATHFTVRLNDATISWLFSLESSCPGIPDGVSITPDNFGSDRVKQATLVERPDGSKRVVITDLVTGTATDNFGVTYTFVYQNDATFDFDGSTVLVKMKDTFKLKGGDVNYTVGFNWRWEYPADSLEIVEFIDEGGETVDVFVDPFFFATADGVTEDPSIVPGSWQQLSTRGEVLSCDPL